MSSYYSRTPGDTKSDWHWIGTAISLAHTIGLHRAYDNPGLSAQEIRLRRRVWWSCYIRDRLMSLSMCRLMRIQDDGYDTPMLTADDFDLIELKIGLTPSVLSSVAIDSIEAEKLVEISTKMIQLCQMVGRVLSFQYSTLPDTPFTLTAKDPTGEMTPMLFPRSHLSPAATLAQYDDQLQLWYSELPASCTHPFPRSTYRDISRTSAFHASMLNLVFFATISALHRPALRQTPADQTVEDRQISRKRIFEAAIQFSKIDRNLHRLGLDRFLPGTAISLQISAIAALASVLKSSNQQRKKEYLDHITNCLRIVENLRDVYWGVDAAIAMIHGILARADIVLHIENCSLRGLTYNDQSCWLDRPSSHQSPGEAPSPSVAHQADLSPQPYDTTILNTSEPEPCSATRLPQLDSDSLAPASVHHAGHISPTASEDSMDDSIDLDAAVLGESLGSSIDLDFDALDLFNFETCQLWVAP